MPLPAMAANTPELRFSAKKAEPRSATLLGFPFRAHSRDSREVAGMIPGKSYFFSSYHRKNATMNAPSDTATPISFIIEPAKS